MNELLTYFGYPIMFGVSATYWWHKHVVVHHPNPNVVGVDDDIDLAPYFAVTENCLDGARGVRRLYYSMQWVLLPLALFLNGFNILLQSTQYIVRALRDPQVRNRRHWVDAGCLGLHVLLWFVVPMWFFSPASVLLFHLVRDGMMGYATFIAFAPAHFPEEAACLASSETRASFAWKQTAATVNFRTGRFGRLLCAGVDYQIEHHLFPEVSHTYYPELSVLLREFCARHGYAYRTLGWGEALWKSMRAFYRPKVVETRASLAAGPVDARMSAGGGGVLLDAGR